MRYLWISWGHRKYFFNNLSHQYVWVLNNYSSYFNSVLAATVFFSGNLLSTGHLWFLRRGAWQEILIVSYLGNSLQTINFIWLMVGPPLWKIGFRQLGWLATQYIYIYGKIKKMATKPPTSYGESKVFTWGGENLGGVHRSNRTQHHPPWICAGWWTAMTAMTMSNFQSLNFRKTTFFLHDRTCHL